MRTKKPMPRLLARAVALLVPLISGCNSVPTIPGFTPYRMEIQQGNFVDQDMASRLKPGMSRDQVRFILGTPLVADVFHADRWDYVFSRRPQGGGGLEQRRLSVFFEDNKLKRVDGDVVPAGIASEGSAR
jgi:outer membrane protein assembly factor BamE